MTNTTQLTLSDIRKKYDKIDCFFTYFDGEKCVFDFYGTNESGIEVRFSIGGCPAWIRDLSFGIKEPLNISAATEHHVKYMSVTDANGKVVYEQFFDTN